MPTEPAFTRDRAFRLGWIIVLVVSAFALIASLYVLIEPVNDSFFEETTGVSLREFQAANPEVASNMRMENRLIGVAGIGLSLFALSITWSRLRRGDRWAARVMWILPLAMAGWTLVFVSGGAVGLAVFYGALAIACAFGLVLVYRAMGPERVSVAGQEAVASSP